MPWDKARCDNCGTVWDADDLKPVRDIWSRVEPGDTFPAGECPEENCRALCFPIHNGDPSKPRNEQRRAKALHALNEYHGDHINFVEGDSQHEILTDLLSDLCHFFSPETVEAAFNTAVKHYEVESECPGCRGITVTDYYELCDSCMADTSPELVEITNASLKQEAADAAREAEEDRAIEDEITATAEYLYGPVEGKEKGQ